MREIKLQCDCGQKYKFEVEPNLERMPFPVQCPVCGADGTARANVILQQHLPVADISAATAPPVAVAPPPPGAPSPSGIVLPPPPPPPSAVAPPRIVAAPPVPHWVSGQNAPSPVPVVTARMTPVLKPVGGAATTPHTETADAGAGRVREIKLGWKTWLIVGLLVVLGLAGTYKKWSKRLSFVADMVGLVSDIASGEAGNYDEAGFYTGREETVFAEEEFCFLVLATNETAVVEAITKFWSSHNKEQLIAVTVTNFDGISEQARFLVYPAREGTVQVEAISFEDETPGKTLATTTRAVSQQLGAPAACEVSDLEGKDDLEKITSTIVFYQNGERKFQWDHTLRFRGRNLKESSQVTGDAWATEAGFKAGPGGYAAFSRADVEKLARLVGYRPAGTEPVRKCLALEAKGVTP
jgi:hypothetical protein